MFYIDIKGSPHSHPVRPIQNGSGSVKTNSHLVFSDFKRNILDFISAVLY